MNKNVLQRLENLPDEILSQPRWFEVGADKIPHVKDWSNPQNQKLPAQVAGIAGFDISGHDLAPDYAVVDFDHVLNPDGSFVNAQAEKWYKTLAASSSFHELSISCSGLHFIFKPSPDKFSPISNGKSGVLKLGGDAKIELFYRTRGRYFLFTGNVYHCSPKAAIVDGQLADDALQSLLDEIAKQSATQPARQSIKLSTPAQIDSTEFDDFRVRRMLDVLPVGYLHGDEWFSAMTAIKNIGFTYDEFDAMNQGGENYNEAENRARWFSDTDPNIGIGTLYNLAAQYGYDAKATFKEWLELHPELRPSRGRKLADDMKSELDAAIIWLRSLSSEIFTVADARDRESIHSVALAAAFGFHADVEFFFNTLKAAKVLAKNRLKEDDADLTKKLPNEERLLLSALAEGTDLNYLRRAIERETNKISREHADFLRQEKIQERKAQAEAKRQQKAAQVTENLSRIEQLRQMPATPERDAELIQLIRDSCDWHCNRQGVPEYVKATAANIDKIFSNDPNLDGLFGYDQFQQADVFLKSPIWNPEAKKGEEWKDRDDSQLQLYLRRNYGEFTNKELTLTAVTSYSDARRFHEVKEFFWNLPKWDGKPRAKKLFVKFLGADDKDFTHEVTLNVLTAAVARIFEPGCDYQLAPILLGEQGIGKSYLLGKLFGKWYGSLVDDVGDPHAIDAIQKLWGVEIKEMAAMKKDVDANKRFIDSAKDTRRQAYARRATTVPRHCVFFITTNNKMCLTDMTGNRRYPIIVCHNKARHYVEGLTDKYILQVWAEVFAHYQELFKDGFDEKKLELSRAAQIKSDEIAEEYLRDDGMESEVRAYLETKIPPLVIWYLLSREERRKFFSDGGRIQIEQADLEARFKNRAGKKYDAKLADFEKACTVKEGFVRRFTDRDDQWQLVFYGVELREHICAVEIYNECFGNDRRKSPTRINEILNRIEGWSLGARIQKADPAYLDQKKVFYRNDD